MAGSCVGKSGIGKLGVGIIGITGSHQYCRGSGSSAYNGQIRCDPLVTFKNQPFRMSARSLIFNTNNVVFTYSFYVFVFGG